MKLHRLFELRVLTLCFAALISTTPSGACLAAEDPLMALDKQKARIEELERELAQRQGEFTNLQRDFQQRQQQAAAQQNQVDEALRAAKRDFQKLQAAMAQAAAADRQVTVFSLENLQANNAADTIMQVLNPKRNDELSVAIDQRANRLIASGTEKRIRDLSALLKELDVESNRAAQSSQQRPAAEMLQVRIIWLTNSTTSKSSESAVGKLDPRVLKTLEPLGFPAPAIACQTLTSIVVTDNQNAFSFTVPVAIDETVTSFQGNGIIQYPVDSNKYLLNVELRVGERRGPAPSTGCQLKGSIATPLGNYTVLGTGVVVAPGREPKQMPCAFVLQLTSGETAETGPESKDSAAGN